MGTLDTGLRRCDVFVDKKVCKKNSCHSERMRGIFGFSDCRTSQDSAHALGMTRLIKQKPPQMLRGFLLVRAAGYFLAAA